jgi:hypothetical protein
MSFRTTSVLMMLMTCLTWVGCSLPTGENPPEQAGFRFKPGEKTQCLSEVLPVMQGFVKGDASDAQVAQIWDCFGGALELFGRYIRGGEDGRYSSRELANFFELYFLKDVKISDRLLVEIMRLKQIFVGGANDNLTAQELQDLMAFSKAMKGLSLRLLPYMKVYSMNWKATGISSLGDDVHYFEAANVALQEGSKELAGLISKNNQPYTLTHFPVLLDEFSKLYGESWPIVEAVQRTMPLVQKLKRTLAGGDEAVVAAAEWRRFALLGARGYVQFLRYHYFIAESTQQGTSRQWVFVTRSFDDLFSYLGDMVAEKPEKRLSRAEVLEIAQAMAQFFPGFKISDGLLLELMKVKRLVFGGGLTEFTTEDFRRAQEKVGQFTKLTEKILSYVQVYGLSWSPEKKEYEEAVRIFKAADQNLLSVAKAMGGLIEDSYDLSELLLLVGEYEKLYPPENPENSMTGSLRKYMPMIVAARQLIFSDTGSVIDRNKKQWPDFLITSAGLYNRYMQYFYFLESTEVWTHGHGLQSLSGFVNDILLELETVLARKPGATISYAELEKLTAVAGEVDVLPDALPMKILNDLWRVVFAKFLLSPDDRLQGRWPAGLSRKATELVRKEFEIWRDNQRIFDGLFKSSQPGEMLTGLEIVNALSTQPKAVGTEELLSIYRSPLSRSFDSLGRLSIRKEPTPYTRKAADTVNLIRAVSRLGLRSYAQEKVRIERNLGLNLLEAQTLYFDLKPLLVQLDLVAADNVVFADSRFRESNLFTPRADGNQLASFNELFDLALGIFSGIRLNGLLEEKLKAKDSTGCALYSSPSSKDIKVSVQCLTKIYAREMPSIFASMPSMADYMSKLPRCSGFINAANETSFFLEAQMQLPTQSLPGPWNDVQKVKEKCPGTFDSAFMNILKASGFVDKKDGLIALGDASLAPHLFQYIETVIQRFDRPHISDVDGKPRLKDGILERQEAMEAFPVLREILVAVSGYCDEKTLRGSLAWILENGRPPEGAWELIKFISYMNFPESWKINVDRPKLAAILGFIAEALEKKPGKQTPEPKKCSLGGSNSRIWPSHETPVEAGQ